MATLRLEDQLCFALYSASRAVSSAYRPLLDELNLTYPQYLVLLVLWEDDACTIGQLGDRLHLDSGTLSPLIKRLEAAGLVRRQRSNADERRVDVTLTAEGRALEDRAACIPERLLGSTDADPAQLAALREALTLITSEVYARNG
ncbi:MarR family winged helix-turn-helix transcriptional regulator [Mycolicibacterium poriferae]|uniref:MarR family winged helix-turn-helix transcriptional regulator n=1 Tax=Mycolicibacterium poriferae TaxID=39694 RepID=UPI00321B1A56